MPGGRPVVFASTGGAIYGDPQTIPATEDLPRRPESPYGVSTSPPRATRPVQPPPRPVHRGAALLQRLRPPPGSARRGRRDRDLLRTAGGGGDPLCSATVSRRATTCSWTTSSGERPRRRIRRGRCVQHRPGHEATVLDLVEALGPMRQTAFEPDFEPERNGRGAAAAHWTPRAPARVRLGARARGQGPRADARLAALTGREHPALSTICGGSRRIEALQVVE